MLPVSFIGSYTEDEQDFPRRNNLILQKTGVWHRQLMLSILLYCALKQALLLLRKTLFLVAVMYLGKY